jgi:DNA replication and repair protein RecF
VRIAHLGLTDFRNYPSLEVDLSPGVNILLGSNGQGKTNAVEAVAYLATFGSHRVANDTALVRAGCDSAVIRSTVTHGDRTIGLDVQINPGRSNRLQVNRSPVRRTRDALGIVRAVMFAPEDLSLVKGEPGARRRFLDQLLVQSSPKFAGVIADYDKVLRQRNSLLRSAAKSSSGLERDTLHSTLAVWDERLVTFGSQIMAGRVGVLADIREPAAAAYAEVAQTRNRLELRYVPSRLSNGPQTEQDFAQELTRCLGEIRKEEFARAVTLVGPHRDELEIGLNDLPARGYASHGESWSVALALRLASFEMLQTDQSGEPILILDDVFAELDSVRRERLAQIASRSPGQVLITAAVSDDVPEQLSGVRFLVDNATIGELR